VKIVSETLTAAYGIDCETMKRYDISVAGAGPSGLFCALQAAGKGARVILFEKMPRPGKKLLLSGAGQCNLTHSGEIGEFLLHYGNHGKFLKPALMGFRNSDLTAFFASRGVSLVTEDNGKIFPASGRSSDILDILLKECTVRGVDMHCAEGVRSILATPEGFRIETPRAYYESDYMVIATGGLSYPATGSTGDGYRLAASLGQPVADTAPALTPVQIHDHVFSDLSGISFADMQFSIWRDGKKIADRHGDVLFTHSGLSGPGILDSSRYIEPGDVIRLSFIRDLNKATFTIDLGSAVSAKGSRTIRAVLATYPIPERVARKILTLSGIPEGLTCAHIRSDQRSRLATLVTECPFVVEALGDYSIAMVTRGGISLDAVNSRTLESKIIRNLYFTGEVMDIDGDTGGYNLQAAFSTGHLAAQSILKKITGK
jgi:hypothetical protein